METHTTHAPISFPDGKVTCICGDHHCASLTQIEHAEYSEQEFHEKYKPIDHPLSGEPTWTWQELKENNIPTHKVWTIVETGDAEDENWYATPGYHIVNKIDYAVTEVPWEHENITAVWFEDDFER